MEPLEAIPGNCLLQLHSVALLQLLHLIQNLHLKARQPLPTSVWEKEEKHSYTLPTCAVLREECQILNVSL